MKSSDFTYTYVREQNSKLSSAIDRRGIKWTNLLIHCGLDPRCHIRSVTYGKTVKEKEKVFKVLVKEFISKHGKENLNDNEVNSNISIDIPLDIFLNYTHSSICKKSKCKPFQITGRSIYAKGRSLYGNWKKALEECDIDYENEVLRKVAQHTLLHVLERFDKWDKKKKGNWIVVDLRSDISLERSIQNTFTNKNRSFPFSNKSPDKIFVAWMTLNYFRQFNEIQDDSS